ncbi:gamma-glutamyl-gamma-aminobutyrate hydrolase family protein [Ancylobacter sp. A5.8]|uniref:glutamine amidotransferase-related protein n=1 Tax=Ancylobacter gelatini TaxID=2919920 RepID=UPI001F4EB37E|nr:gamma-glutamyl-gamma-aminobutyrate hydrolase family protein [Ancylobacter gelatini]MCJ8145052.1 gamma-glutamyl-gamma-aminobutyrate hydrolase family protein [Ancylobacter gelatini]
MTIVLVVHDTPLPALDGMIAGEIAAERGARFTTLVTGGGGHGRFDCHIHVLAHGEMAPNGVFWAERAIDGPVAAPVDRGAVVRLDDACVVVPINPHLPIQAEAARRIAATAAAAGRAVETLVVTERDGVFELRDEGGDTVLGAWRLDEFGRPFRLDMEPAPVTSPALTIVVVGDEALMREVYPANIAALGDAAEALGLNLSLRFVDPRDEPAPVWEHALAEADGLLLPGGSDMEQVRGQTEAARFAIRRDLPTVGLCLGMQTMTTAVAQEICGFNDANLAEADPSAQTKTFVRLHDMQGRPMHRLGIQPCRIEPGTRLAALVDGAATLDIHYNHRFVLEPELQKRLSDSGLSVSGWQAERNLADAIEVPGLRFFIGMQGHPELASRRGRPHPLIAGFLKAASGA